MAVYKPTLCYPFSNGLDIRTGVQKISETGALVDPAQCLTCRIETSNVAITGYSVALFSTAHEQIFPKVFEDTTNKIPYVSPISELQYASLGYDAQNPTGVNSGVNGATLRIPFFRATRADTDYPRSLNAIYYQADYVVAHLILDETAAEGAPSDWPARRDPSVYTNVDEAEYWKQTTRTGGTYLIHTTTTDPTDVTHISNASYVANGGALICDGEPLIVGDLVGVILGTEPQSGAPIQMTKGGIYEVATIPAADDDSRMIFALKLRNTLALKSRLVVWQGASLHNTMWEVTADGLGQRGALDDALWCDTYGNPVELDARGAHYQWEITLYQGTTAIGEPLPILPADTALRTRYGGWVDYTTIGPQWFDNIVTGGQIMGSTPERLQLADASEQYLPAGTDSDPLVLQDTFCSMFPLPAGSATDYTSWSSISRFPVHDYDARYGHVYPYAKTLLGLSPPSAEQWCAFYEHSTNPQEILDTDIVDYAYATELPLSFWHVTDGAWQQDSVSANDYSAADLWKGVSVTERYLVVGSDGSYNPNPTGSGGQILLTAQSRRWQNGVWQIKTMEAAWGNSTSKRYYLTRAAKYETWGDFIGRIVYAPQPSSGNWTSLAAAGAANLWNYQDVDMQYGRGDLVFSPERPILLFREKLWHVNNFTGVVRSVDLYSAYSAGSGFIPQDSDGARQNAWQIGDYVADRTGTIYYVASCTRNHTQFTLERVGNAANYAFIYVVNFARTSTKIMYDAGGTVYTWVPATDSEPAGWQQTWELHRAKILKNNTTYTYVSPWVKGVVDARMSMKLLSPGTAVVANSNTTTDIIRIRGLNDVVYRLDHDALDEPMEAYGASNPFIPYRYNICSYFRTSEPNPFVAYERPYLRLFLEQELLTNLSMVAPSVPTAVETGHPLAVEWLEHITTYVARKLNLGVEYQQFNHTMWESYQWKLYSGDGTTLLQDTGRCYDGLIQTTFYGLANELSANVPYWASVIVENSVGDILEYRLRFEIAAGSQSSFVDDGGGERCWFTAAYDCNTQSNLITFQWADPDQPTPVSPKYSVYRREYEVYEQPGERFEGYRQSDTLFTRDAAGTIPLPRIDQALYEDLTIVGTKPAHVFYVFRGNLGRFVQSASTYREFKGAWEPVVAVRQAPANTYIDLFRDFNISNGRSYQYIIYPAIDEWGTPETVEQTFANYSGLIWEPLSVNAGALTDGTLETSPYNGGAVVTMGDCWSLVELVPEKSDINAPIINQRYRVDNDNIWLFRYDVETGEQTQNLARNEFANLGRYPKFGFGRTNYASGAVSAQLGSELVCSSKYKYIERLSHSRLAPLSTNEKAEMLKQWQAFMYSRNPKLLRDIKGQSWIVQVLASSNRTKNYYPETPDTISFQWKEVGSPRNVIIYGDYNADNAEISKTIGKAAWSRVFAGLGGANAAVPEVPYRITWSDAMWSFDPLNTGTEARIKLGAPPTAVDDYTYAISGAAVNGVGKIGTVTDHSGAAITLPATFDSSALYFWVLNANAPLRLYFPVETVVTADYTNPYVLIPTGDTELVVGANHTAYDLLVVTNNAMAAESNPAYVVAGNGAAAITRLDFIFPADYSAPPSTVVNTDYVKVDIQGTSGSVTFFWVRDDASHGHVLLSGVTAPLKVAISGMLRLAAPTLSRSAPTSTVLVWTSIPNATAYEVYLDGTLVTTTSAQTYDYADYTGTPTAGQHFWTVCAETTTGAFSKETSPVIAQWYTIVSQCARCEVRPGSDSGTWDYTAATIYYVFDTSTNLACPWQVPMSNGQPGVWQWTYYNSSSGSLYILGEDMAGLAADGVITQNTLYINVGAVPRITAPVISQRGTVIYWSTRAEVEKYRVYADYGTDVFTVDLPRPASGGRCQYDLSDYLTQATTYDISVVAFGTKGRFYGTSLPSNVITVTQEAIYATTENGATAEASNPDMIWHGTSVVLKYWFDGVNYICPTTAPTVTGATGSWTKISDLYGELTISSPTGSVVFAISGVPGVSTSYTTVWDTVIEASGTAGTPPAAWDVTESSLAYSFISNSIAYTGIYIDEYGCLYYTANNINTLVFDTVGAVGPTGWQDEGYRTIVSTVDPDTVFLQDWAVFYDKNTDGVIPTPLFPVQWNFAMETESPTDVANYWTVLGSYVGVGFYSNGTSYTRLSVDSDGSIYYGTTSSNTLVYDYIAGWVLPAYRTIACETNPELAFVGNDWSSFYRANTVQTYWKGSLDIFFEVDGSAIWDVRDATLSITFVSNGTTYSSIYIDPEGSMYYGGTMVYEYETGWVNDEYRIITTAQPATTAFNHGDWLTFYYANTGAVTYWRSRLQPEGEGMSYDVLGHTMYCAFMCNGTMYAALTFDNAGNLYYNTAHQSGGTKVYDVNTGWVQAAYRLIATVRSGSEVFNADSQDWSDFYDANANITDGD